MHMNKKIKSLVCAAIVVLALMIFFTRSLGEAVGLAAAVVFIWVIPGYALIHFLLKDGLDELEKVLLGTFMGFGAASFVLYYLNLFGFSSIKPFFGYAIGLVCAALLFYENFKKLGKSE